MTTPPQAARMAATSTAWSIECLPLATKPIKPLPAIES
jgi:hypothetical protein